MGETQENPLKRKRTKVVSKKDLTDSNIVYEHCCTLRELEVIIAWLQDIPSCHRTAKSLEETKIVFPNKTIILGSPMSEKEAAQHSPTGSAENSEVWKRKKLTSNSQSLVLIQQTDYQLVNLKNNNIIYEHDMGRKLPNDVATTWSIIQRSLDMKFGRDITPTMRRLISIQHTGAEQADSLIELLRNAVFSTAKSPLVSLITTRFRPELVPNEGVDNPVSTPWPDLTYAYSGRTAFSSAQGEIIFGRSKLTVDDSSRATFPVLIVEFKGNNPIWMASNQCLGDTATSINLTNILNQLLKKKSGTRIQTTVFSISINAYEAILHVSWEEEGQYIMKDLEFFHLRRREGLLKLDAYVKSILKWGKRQRLNEIRTALDLLV